MQEAIDALNALRDWANENPSDAYWVIEEQVANCIQLLEENPSDVVEWAKEQ